MPNPRSAAEWANLWDMTDCPHDPPHPTNEGAEPYQACLAAMFDAYARQRVEAFRERAAHIIKTLYQREHDAVPDDKRDGQELLLETDAALRAGKGTGC